MKYLSLSLLAAAVVATPVAATPPPLRVAVTYIGPGNSEAEIRSKTAALHARLVEDRWFEPTPSTLHPAALDACGGDDGVDEACLRTLTHASARQGLPEVVVAVSREAGRWRLHCIGPGATANSPERQSVLIDLDSLGREDRTAAASCIIAAAAESGW